MIGEFKSHRVGDVTIIKVGEQQLDSVPIAFLYPDAQTRPISDDCTLRPYLEQGGKGLRLSVHTWVVRTTNHLVLIDTGLGNDKERPRNPVLHR